MKSARALLAALAIGASVPTITFTKCAAAEEDVADPAAEAKKQFTAGMKAFQASRFVEAALAFEAAHYYKPNAVALYTAALAWKEANQPERAADAFGRALDAQGLNPQQSSMAKESLTALEKTMGTLVVTGPPDAKVQVDALTEATVPARLHATPGTHSLTVRLAGQKPEKRDATFEIGQVKEIDVTPSKVEPKIEPKVDTTPKQPDVVVQTVTTISVKRAIGFSAIGVGGAAAVSALIVGLQAVSAGNAYDAAPTREGYNHANALATWSTVLWISAGVFVAAGVTLVLIPEKSGTDKEKPADDKSKSNADARLLVAPTVGGLVLRGAF